MKLDYKGRAVYCKGYRMGFLEPNKFTRREKSTEFSGMGLVLYYDSEEEAKKELPVDLADYFNHLMEEEKWF